MINMQTIKEYILVTIGTLIVALGVYYFLVPENLAAGGVSGLAIVLNNYIPMSISVINFGLNIILLIIGFLFIGFEFGGKTIFSVVVFSLSMFLMESIYPATTPITDEILLNLICGIVISAIGLSLVFNQNASTGGTDIIAKIFNKYFNLDMGTGLMAADVVVVISSLFTYGLKTGIVGAFGWFLNGIVVNYFIDGFSIKREVVIITKNPDEIKNFIFSKIERGITVYKAEGGYTKENKDVIVTTVSKGEYFMLKKELKNLDPDAFVTVRTVHEVIGSGFQKL
nr:YitT family protein [Sedimentibacter sp.]